VAIFAIDYIYTAISLSGPRSPGGGLGGRASPLRHRDRVQDIYKSSTVPRLKGVNLKIPERTTTVILGGSGSGKTVLIKHIMGLFKPDGAR